MKKTDMARIVYSVASTMNCTMCPYKCQSPTPNMTDCSRRWYDILNAMEKEEKAPVLDKVDDLYFGRVK